MKIRKTVASLILTALVATTASAVATPASAQTLRTGDPYGCQINPNAAGCQAAPQPAVAGGSVTGVAGAQTGGGGTTGGGVTGGTTTLPTTGGAAGATPSPAAPVAGVLGSLALMLLGFGIRRQRHRL